jgi:hypothetical protein
MGWFEPATRGEVGGDAGDEQEEADREGADHPAGLEAALEHEAIEQGEHQDQDGGFGKEGAAAVGGDGEEIGEGGWSLAGSAAATGWNEDQTRRRGDRRDRSRGLWTKRTTGGGNERKTLERVCKFFVQHKQTFVLPALSLPRGSIKVELISDKCNVFNSLLIIMQVE